MEYWISEGFGNRVMHELATKGTKVNTHKHDFPHLFICPQGSALVTQKRDGVVSDSRIIGRQSGQYFVDIPAGMEHEMESLEDGTIGMCSFAHRVPQALQERVGLGDTEKHREFDALMKRVIELGNELHGDIVQQYNGWVVAHG